MTSLELNPTPPIESEFNNSIGGVISELRSKRVYRGLVSDFFVNAQTGNVIFFFGDQADIITSFSRGIAVGSLVDSIRLSLLPRKIYGTGKQVSITVKDSFSNSTASTKIMAANLIFISYLSLSFLHDSKATGLDLQKSLVDHVNNALQMTQQYLGKTEENDRSSLLRRLKQSDERDLRGIARQLILLNLN